MRETEINDIEKINTIVLVIGSLAALLIMRDFKYFFSFAVASSAMTLNFRFIKKIMEGAFREGTVNRRALAVKLPLKFLGLVALVVVVILWGDIDVLFFIIGLSTIFISIVVNQVMLAFGHAPRRKQNGA